MWWKTHKWKLLIPAVIVAALAAAFWFGGSAPSAGGWPDKEPDTSVSQLPQVHNPDGPAEPAGQDPQKDEAQTASSSNGNGATSEDAPGGQTTDDPSAAAPSQTQPPSGNLQTQIPDAAGQGPDSAQSPSGQSPDNPGPEQAPDSSASNAGQTGQTDPVPEEPAPVDPQAVSPSAASYTCTMSIYCGTILDNLDLLDPEKAELVPEDGWVLLPVTVSFYEGESVFNVLQRVCKQEKIHMEFSNTPIYNSAYIEGIHNLYEFDTGELSGWMYKVNDWFPNYGCSRYQLKDGDVIEWVYTCDLGEDVGGGYAAGSQTDQ